MTDDAPVSEQRAVGMRLRAARKAAGVTQEDVAGLLDVAQNTYSDWERGRNLINGLAVARLKKVYGITPDWVFCGDSASLPAHLREKVHKITKA